jgi:leader peptidase (prepilin peptidase)/N-methyltransferase
VGSFLNVVIYRTPLHLSVSTPRSFCPTCDRQLEWWENVPLLSWLFLRGRCHTCHERISIRYPLVEATTSLTFGLIAWAWHGTLPTAAYCVLAATAISIALIEYGGKRSPLSVASVGTGLGAVLLVPGLLVVHRGSHVIGAIVGLAIGGLIFGLLRVGDPDCTNPLTFGRTALPLAGLWLGGLGWRPAVSGLAAWVLASFTCVVVVRLLRRGAADEDPAGRTVHTLGLIVGVPLVSGFVVALAVSLGVAG